MLTSFLILIALLVLVGVAVLVSKTQSEEVEEKLPFQQKRFFFSRSEQEFFRLLEAAIDHSKYTVFPKVRLADFVEVTVRGQEYQGWLNKIKSKHIDFLIWHVANAKIALAIELDGNSHQNEKMKASDDFKNKLYPLVGIPFFRVRVGSHFADEISAIVKSLG